MVLGHLFCQSRFGPDFGAALTLPCSVGKVHEGKSTASGANGESIFVPTARIVRSPEFDAKPCIVYAHTRRKFFEIRQSLNWKIQACIK